MNDKEFLKWIYERLLYIYKEKKDYDYMVRLKNLINEIGK